MEQAKLPNFCPRERHVSLILVRNKNHLLPQMEVLHHPRLFSLKASFKKQSRTKAINASTQKTCGNVKDQWRIASPKSHELLSWLSNILSCQYSTLSRERRLFTGYAFLHICILVKCSVWYKIFVMNDFKQLTKGLIFWCQCKSLFSLQEFSSPQPSITQWETLQRWHIR